MIVLALFVCVQIALSSTASANNEIDATCDTSGKNGPNWDGIAEGVLGLFEKVPVLDKILGVSGKVEDIWKAAENEDDGFSKQWELCIEDWITEAIETHDLDIITSDLESMITVTKDNIIDPYIKTNQKHISAGNLEEMTDTVHDLGGIADDIKKTVKGAQNPSAYLIAYDAALLNELTATYLVIAKLNNISYDSNIIMEYANRKVHRMNVWRDYLDVIDTGYLGTKQILKKGNYSFWDDWGLGLKPTMGGGCNVWNEGILLIFKDSYCGDFIDDNEFHCHVENPTQRHKLDFGCHGCDGLFCRYKDSCNQHICKERYTASKAMEKNAKDNVRGLLDGMKRLVDTAHNNFDGLANHHMKLTHRTDCYTQCPASKFDVGCLKRCHSTSKEA